MQRKFVTNLAFLIFVNVLIKPFWIFGIDRVVQNTVGAENYGIYFALFNFSIIFSMILDLGITNYNNRTIAQNNHLLSDYLSNILIIRIFLSVFYFIILWVVGLWLNFNSFQIKLLFFLAFNQILTSFILYFRSNVSALHHFKTDSILSVLDKILMILFCVPLLWGNFFNEPFKIEWFVYTQTIAYFITAFTCLIVVFSFVEKFKIKFDFKIFYYIVRQTIPFATIMLLMAIYNKVDAVMLERMLGDDGAKEAGIYASAYRLIDALSMIGFLFSVLLLPIFSKMLKQKEKVDDLVQLSFKLIFVFAATAAITGYFFQNEIMHMLYREANEYSAKIFGLLLFSFVGVVTVYIFGTLLVANNNMLILNRIVLSGVIINVVMNYWLIPQYHALGAAIVTLCTQIFVASLHLFFAKKILKLNANWKLIVIMAIYCISVLLLCFLLKNIFSFWQINFVLLILLSVLLAFVLRLIDWKKVIQLFRKVEVQ